MKRAATENSAGTQQAAHPVRERKGFALLHPWGKVRVQVEGLSLEKLITRAAEKGIRLSQVQRQGARAITATLRTADLRKLRQIAEAVGWRITLQRESMLRRTQGMMSRRIMLSLGVLVFLAAVWMANACVWFVRIEGAGESVGEVRTVLAEQDVRPGRIRARLDLPALQRALEKRLPRIAWIDVHMRGVTVVVECIPARVPRTAEYGGEASDIVASRDGVVTRMTIAAGIAQVKVGAAVHKGQVLVAGQERTADGATREVPARAKVLSRVWYSGSARVPITEAVGTPTGEVHQRIVICTPWFSWSDQPDSNFAEQDIDIQRQVVGGMFLPVWVQTERYDEVTLSQTPRTTEEMQRESAAIAERAAREKLPFHAQILDKWVEYSMIKDGYFSAEVVLETEEDIALSAPSPSAQAAD